MNILKDFDDWTDKWGLIHTVKPGDQDNASGNGLLYTSEAFILAHLHLMKDPRTTAGEIASLNERLDRFRGTLSRCQVRYGLYNRGPRHTDHEGPDDYIGLGAFAGITGRHWVATEIVLWGREREWVGPLGTRFNYVYNNVEPEKFRPASWLGRFPAIICHLKWAATMKPSVAERAAWAASLLVCAHLDGKHQDAWIQSWLMVQTRRAVQGKSWACDQAEKIWWFALKKKFPEGIRQVVSQYLGNPDHPLVRHWNNFES